ncbi:hypothetical protein LSH36_74g00023 [Paralvinella palmiformis]|uniref:Sushi domain-containing protein n=1 Tax=Paralvinella palmiformis TaxID=53620 RepID=A0AAD9K4F7_9ANNE|nr:hypothetical protein LSH36_74g00023 [Paralvinella palmiformis]
MKSFIIADLVRLSVALFCFYPGVSKAGPGYCNPEEEQSCPFECHCAVKSECRSGTCPSGCQTGPLGYNWHGPGCQIGNVGFGKSARMTVDLANYERGYPAKAALDGRITLGTIDHTCAHPILEHSRLPAEWWADLGGLYKIYSITIYGRRDGFAFRLQQFDLTIYNQSNNEVLCNYQADEIATYKTITCRRPTVGRHVHFKRRGGAQIYITGLCEVIITGHKLYDCSRCPPGVQCDDVIGCRDCAKSYQPECWPDIICPTPACVLYADHTHQSQYYYEDTVTYTCPGGYKNTSSTTLKCGFRGRWLDPWPTCIRKKIFT